MFRGVTILLLFCCFILFSSFGPDEKYVRKAIRFMEKGNLKAARNYYERAIEKNPENYRANLGMGLLLSELLGNYSGGLPYLEKAFKITQTDTVPALMYALAKCYQHNGDYEKALSLFSNLKNYRDVEEEVDLEKDISKRIEDCNYGVAHRTDPPAGNWYIVNAGRNINSDMPEYVPVLTPQNELIFTSRRKDDEKEELSYLDGKYFESMYISEIHPSGFQQPRRYTLPDHLAKSHYLKRHESVVSMSPDGQKLFTFRDNKIYEISMDQRAAQSPKKLLKTINFDYYQNHAFLSKDGNTLYFTSEARGGIGGIDIYKATKIKEGEWSKPENIGAPVNTEFDEDSPFLSDDGNTLYFASNGHKGYGNFDIFKSELKDGKWSEPVNLGQPVNSAGHDIFLVMEPGGASGYFSSSRNGGFGDMDIYKINDLDKMNKACPSVNPPMISLQIRDQDPKDFENIVEVTIPPDYKIMNAEWKVNGEIISNGAILEFKHDYRAHGSYTVNSKIVAWCDTCFSPLVSCNVIMNDFIPAAVLDSMLAAKDKVKEKTLTDASKMKGELSTGQLSSIGFNGDAILFDFAKSEIKPEYESILKTNCDVLKKNPNLKVEIVGFTDSRGPRFINEILSAKRASEVKAHLIACGVKRSQIKMTSGKGFAELVNDCGEGKECDEAMHQQNRRVVFKVYAE
jgi:outer membrane protein OmpA-like peptidoglycan-associated protein/tetratricopeptide (TPR) repeat protein